MAVAVEPLIAALRAAVPFSEVRPATTASYLEAVVPRQELKRCYDLLAQHFGPAVKEFGQPSKLDRATAKLVDRLGGVWPDQCLFLSRGEAKSSAYAALWPWSSDPSRVTVKVGTVVE